MSQKKGRCKSVCRPSEAAVNTGKLNRCLIYDLENEEKLTVSVKENFESEKAVQRDVHYWIWQRHVALSLEVSSMKDNYLF